MLITLKIIFSSTSARIKNEIFKERLKACNVCYSQMCVVSMRNVVVYCSQIHLQPSKRVVKVGKANIEAKECRARLLNYFHIALRRAFVAKRINI